MPVTLGRGRRPAPTNRSRQQLQRERALQLAAKQKEGSHSLPLEQQLTKPPDPPVVSHPAPVKSRDESKPLESQLVQHEAEPVDRESPPESVPPAIVKELDKQEVELLVSLVPLQTWAQILICSCEDIFHYNISYRLNIVLSLYKTCLNHISHQI